MSNGGVVSGLLGTLGLRCSPDLCSVSVDVICMAGSAARSKLLSRRLRVLVFYNMFPVADDIRSWVRRIKLVSCMLGSRKVFKAVQGHAGVCRAAALAMSSLCACCPPHVQSALPGSNCTALPVYTNGQHSSLDTLAALSDAHTPATYERMAVVPSVGILCAPVCQ